MTSATLPRPREGRRALDVAKAVASAPVALLAGVWLVLLPAGVAINAWDLAADSGSVVLQVIVVVVLAAAAAAVFWWSVGRRGIKSLLRLGRFELTARAAALAGFAVVAFTAGTALLFERGLIGITPAPARDEVLDQALVFYVWHIANTVPLVDIPGNLEWAKPFEFDGPLGGLLVIVFTGFVIFPLIQLARLVLAGGELPYDGAVVRALGELVGGGRMTEAGDHEGYGRAIVDGWVVIDVMREVWNHDAAALRLERLAARSIARRPRGYLLVVDAIAEGARERLELALSSGRRSRPRWSSGAVTSAPGTWRARSRR